MGFSAFRNAIVSPALQRVADHWHAAGGTRPIPAWSEINPRAIAAQLPIVWSYKYDEKTAEFMGRLAGERITEAVHRNIRGLSLSEVQPLHWAYALCKRVATEPAFCRCAGRVLKHVDRSELGERIILPLSGKDGHIDGILGATYYRFEPDAAKFAKDSLSGDIEQWFPVFDIRCFAAARKKERGLPARDTAELRQESSGTPGWLRRMLVARPFSA